MPYPDEDFKDDHTPVGFLITFRCFGTWLHGDRRGSVDRFHNVYGTPKLGPERARVRYERKLMTRAPVHLSAKRRGLSGFQTSRGGASLSTHLHTMLNPQRRKIEHFCATLRK